MVPRTFAIVFTSHPHCDAVSPFACISQQNTKQQLISPPTHTQINLGMFGTSEVGTFFAFGQTSDSTVSKFPDMCCACDFIGVHAKRRLLSQGRFQNKAQSLHGNHMGRQESRTGPRIKEW